MSFASLAAFFWSSLLAARVACRQYVDVTAQAAGLAVQVGYREQAARMHLLGGHEAPINVAFENQV
jgi:hypothetical protein